MASESCVRGALYLGEAFSRFTFMELMILLDEVSLDAELDRAKEAIVATNLEKGATVLCLYLPPVVYISSFCHW